jgi:hypothetical protein
MRPHFKWFTWKPIFLSQFLNCSSILSISRWTTARFVFAARHVSLWLPQSVDITVHLSGKQFNARHSYSNYQLSN